MVDGTLDLGLFSDALQNLSIFDSTFTFIVSCMLLVVIMAFITREVNKWKILAFPILMSLRMIEVRISLALLMIAGIFFVIEGLSIQTLGNIIQGLYKTIKPVGLGTTRLITEKFTETGKAQKQLRELKKIQKREKPFLELGKLIPETEVYKTRQKQRKTRKKEEWKKKVTQWAEPQEFYK